MKTDTQLQREVLQELRREPSVNAADIGVMVVQSIVTLVGHVPSYAEKYGAGVVKNVPGIRAVADELEVHLPGSEPPTDAEITGACLCALKATHQIPINQIRILVDGGRVTLQGEVEWQGQKEAAQNAVRYLAGVNGVSNDIQIRPLASAADVKHKVQAALHRTTAVNTPEIDVEAQDGQVVLLGHVHSWNEREEAWRAAWATPGVTAVENWLTIGP